MPRKSRLNLQPIEIGDETIGQRITRIRKEQGYTQKELAEKIGLVQNLISDYEHDKLRLNADMLVRFAIALNITPDILLGFKNTELKTSSPSLKIIRRLNKIEQLPINEQKFILKTIDSLVKATKKAS